MSYWHVSAPYAKIVRDHNLDQFRSVIGQRAHAGQMTAATLVGTFFAGKPVVINGRKTEMRGFGHMGCCSLFVLSRVESVTADYSDELDYSWAEWNFDLKDGCFSEQMAGVPPNETLRKWQRDANAAANSSHFDPKKVAEEELKSIQSQALRGLTGGRTDVLAPKKSDMTPPVEPGPPETLIETDLKPYLKQFTWIMPDRQTWVLINVARPHWLLEAAGSPKKVIWAPVGASVLSCVPPKGKH